MTSNTESNYLVMKKEDKIFKAQESPKLSAIEVVSITR